MKTCSVPGCGDPATHKEWCARHYMNWKRTGNPIPKFTKGGALRDRHKAFWDAVDIGLRHECWTFAGHVGFQGYGIFGIDGAKVLAHRHSWELFFGPVPDGLQVIHQCMNKLCVNPYHLTLGTDADNAIYPDRRGEGNGMAIVPDSVVEEAVARYRRGGISQAAIATELTTRGYPTSQVTVGRWCRGARRGPADSYSHAAI